MPALRIHAGPAARRHIERHGLSPKDVRLIAGAAGGPKGLILGPLDRFVFGEWLPQSTQPIDLVGASIGAWRMATACLNQSVKAFERLEHDYIHQHYELPAGQKRVSAEQVSREFGRSSGGNFMSSASVCALRSIENHCTPMARPGMRCAGASSARRRVATR